MALIRPDFWIAPLQDFAFAFVNHRQVSGVSGPSPLDYAVPMLICAFALGQCDVPISVAHLYSLLNAHRSSGFNPLQDARSTCRPKGYLKIPPSEFSPRLHVADRRLTIRGERRSPNTISRTPAARKRKEYRYCGVRHLRGRVVPGTYSWIDGSCHELGVTHGYPDANIDTGCRRTSGKRCEVRLHDVFTGESQLWRCRVIFADRLSILLSAGAPFLISIGMSKFVPVYVRFH